MAFKTFHFVQGLYRTPLLFIPRYLTNIFSKKKSQKKYLENRTSENLKFQKPRFTNKCAVLRFQGRLARPFWAFCGSAAPTRHPKARKSRKLRKLGKLLSSFKVFLVKIAPMG